MAKKTIRDAQVKDKRCFVRVDFNVPMKEGRITDDSRIRQRPHHRVPYFRGAKVILASLTWKTQRQGGARTTLGPRSSPVGRLLGRKVVKLSDCVGPEVGAYVSGMSPDRSSSWRT